MRAQKSARCDRCKAALLLLLSLQRFYLTEWMLQVGKISLFCSCAHQLALDLQTKLSGNQVAPLRFSIPLST